MTFKPEVETAAMEEYIAMIGDVLVEREAGSDREAIRAVVRSDFTNPSFARGFALGAASVLKCGGIPAFLTGEEADNLLLRVMTLMSQFKVIEAIEARGAKA